MAYKPAYKGEESGATTPNRTPEEVSRWAQQTAAELLTFNTDNYQGRLTEFKKYFVPTGWQPYADFLRHAQIIDRVKDGGYGIGAIVSSPPDITNQGAVEGAAYHWIIRVPVTISFFPRGKTTAESSGVYTLFMDVTRTAEDNPSGLAIKNWRIDATPVQP